MSMALPSRPKQPIYAAGYYTPRRLRPVHFLPPMKVKLKDPSIKLKDATSSKHTDEDHGNGATGHFRRSKVLSDRRGRYRKMVMTLACNLTMENVADMKFLCRGKFENVTPL